MEQELKKDIFALEAKIKDDSKLSEKELITCKNAFEEITGTRATTMMSCAGKLCEVFKRVLLNWMKINNLVNLPIPVKLDIPKPKIINLKNIKNKPPKKSKKSKTPKKSKNGKRK